MTEAETPSIGITPGIPVFPWWLILIQGIITLILGIMFLVIGSQYVMILEDLSVVKNDVDRIEDQVGSLIRGTKVLSQAIESQTAIPEEADDVFFVRDVHNLILLDKIQLYRSIDNVPYSTYGKEFYQWVVPTGAAGFVIGDNWLNLDVQPGDVVYPIVSDGPPFWIEYKICNREGCGPRVETGFDAVTMIVPTKEQ